MCPPIRSRSVLSKVQRAVRPVSDDGETVGATARVNVVDLVTPPPVAVTVIGKLLPAIVPVLLMLNIVEQFGLQVVDENDADAPEGNPEIVRETG